MTTATKKKFMTGVYSDLHFICELTPENEYKCIPKYSKGNGTIMTFFEKNPNAKFYDTLDEALNNKTKHNNHLSALKEEDILTGKRNANGSYRHEY